MKIPLHRILLTCLLVAGVTSLHAQSSMVPSAMNYQGLLTDTNGDPVAPTAPENRTVEFRLYSQPLGGTPLWGEAQTVTVFKGNFSVILGNGTALSGVASSGPTAFASVFTNAASSDLYFGITPQGGAEFTPRQKLLSSAFALRAKTAESVNGLAQPLNSPAQFNAASVNQLTLNGDTLITGNQRLLFGVGDPDKQNSNAGTIGYKRFSQGLDIVGAGNNALGTDRKITLWAEGGADFAGPINFPNRHGQQLNFYDGNNAIGSQPVNGTFFRSYNSFSWFRGGIYSSTPGDAGAGGSRLASLNSSGFTLDSGIFTGNGSGLTNLNPNSLPSTYNYLGITGSNVVEFGQGVTKGFANGIIGYQTYTSGLDIVGAGTSPVFADRRITLHCQGGISILGNTNVSGSVTASNGVTIAGNSLSFTNRLGQLIQLYDTTYGLGIQDNTCYFRTGSGASFAWYRGGTHSDVERDSGGGTALAYLNGNGLWVNGPVTANNSSLNAVETNYGRWKTNGTPDYNFVFDGTLRYRIDGNGNPFKVSDRKLKTDVESIGGALHKVMELRPCSYRFKSQEADAPKSMGFIAQEVQAVLPGLVSHMGEGTLGLNYDSFIPITVAAVQEQQKQIETLGSENSELKKRLSKLEAKLEKLSNLPPAAPASPGKVGGQ